MNHLVTVIQQKIAKVGSIIPNGGSARLHIFMLSVLWVVLNILISTNTPHKKHTIQAFELEDYSHSQAPQAFRIILRTEFSTSLEKDTEIEIRNFNKDYDYPPVAQKLNTVRIPILMYHHIAPLPSNPSHQKYFVTPAMFERQMKYLVLKGYKTLIPKELYNQLESGKNPIQKSVMLTFDDGHYNNYTTAFPILKKYDLTGVFNINSNSLRIPPFALREMSDEGMIIASHSANHINLRTVSINDRLVEEINGSKVALEAITDKSVSAFAYPGCVCSNRVIAQVEESDYLIGLTCSTSIDHKFEDKYKLQRFQVVNNFENFKKLLSGIWEYTSEYGE